MKNIGVILAGGSGKRLGGELPKQYLKIAGKMVIEHTIEVFQKHPCIDEIAVVCHHDYINTIEVLVINNKFNKVKKILSGGAERYHSSLAAIEAYDDGEEKKMIFHDAVRPLLTHRIINDCIDQLDIYNAVDVAIPATDTIISLDQKQEVIDHIPERRLIYKGQTPQAFKLSTIKEAYELAINDPQLKVTDDCGIIKTYLPQEDVFVVRGEEFNMKLTHKEDLFLLDKLFQLRSASIDNSALSQDEINCLKSKIVVIFGGSYGIGGEIVKICQSNGIKVYSFSRSQNNVDITHVEEVRKVLAEVHSNEGRIDYIINTAGVLQKEPLAGMDYDDVKSAIDVNYLGAVIVAKEAFKYLEESKGSFLLFTSSSYTRGRAMYSLYSSLKAAIVNLIQALCDEWDGFDINVNCINPERTKTPMRIKNFGNEPEGSLLGAVQVANASLRTVLADVSGQVVDVRR